MCFGSLLADSWEFFVVHMMLYHLLNCQSLLAGNNIGVRHLDIQDKNDAMSDKIKTWTSNMSKEFNFYMRDV